MKIRFLCMVAAVALLGACSSDDTATQGGAATATAPTATAPAKPGVVPGSQADFVANVGDRVFFAFDKYSLTPEGKDQLAKWVAFLKKYPSDQLVVEGHADERGTREYNLALGERRANSVKDFLVSQGVQATRLKVISYGKERPAVLGSNETSWAQNRRAVGVVQ
ncbi:peptidoglycan-associated lipoprotein Pal [Telmatospirillum sp.]|uniref:peptidoglycan-associated lipoprotein Pal n=1 Tax=Telmatospirillum sp. TaxID=2079197 RepID=UPI00283CBAC0|nr:peptidoglycan-associated lipoprotein Pal [Telmatospirillum sp.]MDR3437954.1 peptidoglycan-associated lipoprotein Pal [Telmatospirillum sp.]